MRFLMWLLLSAAAVPFGFTSLRAQAPVFTDDELVQPVYQLLRDLHDYGRENRMLNVPPQDGRLLQMLVRMNNCKNVVEVGTSNGLSAIWMALGLRETGGIQRLRRAGEREGGEEQRHDECDRRSHVARFLQPRSQRHGQYAHAPGEVNRNRSRRVAASYPCACRARTQVSTLQYSTGSTIRVNASEVTSPPRTTAASGCWISEPLPVA